MNLGKEEINGEKKSLISWMFQASRDDYIKSQLDKKYSESFQQFKESQNEIVEIFDTVNNQINQLKKKVKI